MKKKISIIGLGFVGKAEKDFWGYNNHYEVVEYDEPKNIGNREEVNSSDLAVICVPTSQNKDGSCDISIVENVISWINTPIILIKSTIPPGTSKYLSEKFNKNIVFSPEFIGEETYWNPYKNEKDPLKGIPHIILGRTDKSSDKNLIILYNLIIPIIGPKKDIYFTDSSSAEMCKYMLNSYLALKVTFANEIKKICDNLNINYGEVRELWSKDSRVDKMHTIVFEDSPGFGGKCLLANTLMYVNNSIKEAKDVKVGDSVLTIDGSWRKVLRKFDRITNDKKENLFIIKGQGMEEFGLTSDHPVLAVKSNRYFYGENRKKLSNYKKDNYELEWIDATNLEKGDFIVLPRIKERGYFSLSHFSDNLIRLFGYFVAEGNIEKKKDRISFAFNSNETNYIKDVVNIVKNEFGINAKINNNLRHTCSVIRFTDKRVSNLLKQHCGEMADKKVLSNEIMTSNNVSEFLKGYFRGDGSKSTGIYSMSTISKKLYYQLKLILLKFGIGFTINIKEARIDKNRVNHKKVFTIRIRNYTEIKKFNDLIGDKIEKDLKLFRKTSWFDDKFLYFPIKEIKNTLYSGKVYNFEIEGNQTFTVADAIVHNCLPKDVSALVNFSKNAGYESELFKKILTLNKKFYGTNN
jgi:UDPglucose 6-dehydrogenase